MYILNKKTHCYHIRNGCQYAHGKTQAYLEFDSEIELKSADPSARLCTTCQQKREKMERKNQTI